MTWKSVRSFRRSNHGCRELWIVTLRDLEAALQIAGDPAAHAAGGRVGREPPLVPKPPIDGSGITLGGLDDHVEHAVCQPPRMWRSLPSGTTWWVVKRG
jgi:hypothetical protein